MTWRQNSRRNRAVPAGLSAISSTKCCAAGSRLQPPFAHRLHEDLMVALVLICIGLAKSAMASSKLSLLPRYPLIFAASPERAVMDEARRDLSWDGFWSLGMFFPFHFV